MATTSCLLKTAAPQVCSSSFTGRAKFSETPSLGLIDPVAAGRKHIQPSFRGLQLRVQAQSKLQEGLTNIVTLHARKCIKSEFISSGRDTKRSRQIRTLAVAEVIERSTDDDREKERLDSREKDSLIDEATTEADAPAFDWKAHWYAVGVVQDMDRSIPHPLLLLGQPVVLWYDRNLKSWCCFLDQCPHRLAPLSEGRIDEEGRLQCSYHGWSFEGKGTCACIPQAAPQGPEAKAAANPRAAAHTFPVSEKGGLLFVWPDSGPKAAFKAANTEFPLTPGISPDFTAAHYVRDLEYGYEILAENLMDPAHVPFSHSGLPGITRNLAAPLDFRREGLDPTGFSGLGISGYFAKNSSAGGTESDLPGENPQGDVFSGIRTPVDVVSRLYLSKDCPQVAFQAPNRYSYTWTIAWEDGSVSNFIITSAITPRGPGKSRVVASLYSNFGNKQGKKEGKIGFPNLRRLVVRFSPKWLSHLVLHELFDGDAVFLRRQEMTLQSMPQHQRNDAASNAEAGVRKVDAPNEYFMPTSADGVVLAFRLWLNKYAGGGVPWARLGVSDYAVRPMSREDVLDRFHSHTAQCVTCKSAMEGARKAQNALWVGAALLMAVVIVAGSDLPVPYRVVLATLALMSAGAGLGLSNIIKCFVYTGYSHAK